MSLRGGCWATHHADAAYSAVLFFLLATTLRYTERSLTIITPLLPMAVTLSTIDLLICSTTSPLFNIS